MLESFALQSLGPYTQPPVTTPGAYQEVVNYGNKVMGASKALTQDEVQLSIHTKHTPSRPVPQFAAANAIPLGQLNAAFHSVYHDDSELFSDLAKTKLAPLKTDTQNCPEFLFEPSYDGGRVQFFIDEKPLFSISEDLSSYLKGYTGFVADGLRGLDPWPQKAWGEILMLGHQWPPNPETNLGRMNVVKKADNLFAIESDDLTIGSAYGVKPRGLVKIDRESHSAWVAFQQRITEEKRDNDGQPIALAPWMIAPFAVPNAESSTAESPKALAVFPSSDDSVLSQSTEDNTNNHRWNHFKDHGQTFVLVNPATDAQKAENEEKLLDKQFSATTPWALFGTENSNYLILTRNVQQHKDAFQVYVSDHGLYIELEWTGPLVQKNDANNGVSTVLTHLQVVPVKDLINENTLGSGNEFKQRMVAAAKALPHKLATDTESP